MLYVCIVGRGVGSWLLNTAKSSILK